MISETPAMISTVEKSSEENSTTVKESIPPPKARKPLKVEVRITKMVHICYGYCFAFWNCFCFMRHSLYQYLYLPV